MAKSTPVWKAADYTPYFIFDKPTHTEKEVRKEYSRLRDIAMKRANRLQDYAPAQAEKIRRAFPKLAEIKNFNEVGMRLSAGKAVIDNPLMTKSGIKAEKERLETVTGEKNIPIGTVLEFNGYMASWRTGSNSALVAASDAADLHRVGIYQNYGGTFDDFWKLYNATKNIVDVQ